jgi:membrane protein YdbS with pleckstrin-like domain
MSRQARASPMSVERSRRPPNVMEVAMSVSLIALIIVILLLIGALPSWGYSSGWGYWPSGGLGLVLLILIILMVMGRI